MGEDNSRVLNGAIAWMAKYDAKTMAAQSVELTPEETIEILRDHPGLRASASAATLDAVRPLISQSLYAFLHYMFTAKDAETADRFLKKLVLGVDLSIADPVYLLRNVLLNDRKARAKLPNSTKAAFAIFAWNAVRENRKLMRLQWRRAGKNPSPFPEIA